MIQNELVENYKEEQNPSKKSNILMQLAELQQYLSSYFDSTRYVMEQAAKMNQDKDKEPSAELVKYSANLAGGSDKKKKKKKLNV